MYKEDEIKAYEKEHFQKVEKDPYRCSFHLIPPVGWMNDPNGLCYFKGMYHVFFQYAPAYPQDEIKMWGHYVSEDFINWSYEGVAVYPDTEYDVTGAFSGSAYVEDDILHIFYTGNVELPGDYDYTTAGRLSNTIHITSEDGFHFSPKEVVLQNKDYPPHYSCHIRDPKVFKTKTGYGMVLGGRTKEDRGTILLYQSEDLENWSFLREITSPWDFGFMWECPDIFTLTDEKGNKATILSMSPQGLPKEEFRYQNAHQSGYLFLKGENEKEYEVTDTFAEWDMGFDFYAPQTFEDNKGRRILMGWIGVSGAEYEEPTVENGWIHQMTLPGELTLRDGYIYRYPVKEIEKLHDGEIIITPGVPVENPGGCFDLFLENPDNEEFEIILSKELRFAYTKDTLLLEFPKGKGHDRTIRKCKCDKLENLRILADGCVVEIYANKGKQVFTTKFFPKYMNYPINLQMLTTTRCMVKLHKMRKRKFAKI